MSKETKAVAETPLMKQYNSIKVKYPDAILLFRVGDFYETFGDDAIKAAKVLNITLTRRANGAAMFIELAGFPHHSLDNYLPKLVRAGYRVAICDQLEDPKFAKGIVKRGITELVTPGVSYNDKVLESSANNFLCSLHKDKDEYGVAFLDISTGEFYVAQGGLEYIEKLIQNFKPSELVYGKPHKNWVYEKFSESFFSFPLDEWVYNFDFANELLLKQFNVLSLKGFGIDGLTQGIIAAGAALQYLKDTKHDKNGHLQNISRIDEEKYVWLDKFTIRNLELAYSNNENATTLLNVIDKTTTPMGARLLRRWVALPLKDIHSIQERQKIVTHFVTNNAPVTNLVVELKHIGDLERLVSKVTTGRVNPREVQQLHRALVAIEEIKLTLNTQQNQALQYLAEQLNTCTVIRERIHAQLMQDPPLLVHKGNVIQKGVNTELDELREIAYNGKEILLQIQQKEAERTGITSLKVAFNNVFGYYLEVTNLHKDKVPTEWIRKQTLTNAERYITEELKIYEEKIVGAEDKIQQLETQLYNDLVADLIAFVKPIQFNASVLSQLDCLLSMAVLAQANNYVLPQVNDGYAIDIKNGRHPVIEQHLKVGEAYVSNDAYLDNDEQQVLMITGPNMSGKSALLRQTALIVLLAQIGSYVPADAAEIGIVDKIFTRVGASDNISSGESTFMVEMNETASILNNLSNRSLILLDEIGRGTSTYDGISIAWAIAEYIHEHKHKAKTLFATHYHELNDMSERFRRIKNFNVSVKQHNGKILFTRKLVAGGSEHSFGIHVAQMAGMPKLVIDRANTILTHLEQTHKQKPSSKTSVTEAIADDKVQLSFFQLDDPVLSEIKNQLLQTDINTLTPVEALMKLNDIKKLMGK
jgi:DNA mismatch repair protein MutS